MSYQGTIRNESTPVSRSVWISNRPITMDVLIPSATIAVPSAAPNHPKKRCHFTLCVRTSVD